MGTATATAYKYSVAGHLSFGAPKCDKAQKSSGFWANRTYWLCIKDNVLIDPACGTVGFLVSSAEYIREHYEDEMTDEQWDHYGSTMFTGFDTDRTMLRISAMNLMLHSIANPEIDYKDSVSKQNQISGNYTICLANPPFKGTIDAESINDNLKAITNTNLSSKSLWMKLSYYLISLCRITLVDAKIVLIMKTCHVDNPSRRRDYAKSIFR